MKIRTVPSKTLQKKPHNRGFSLRATPRVVTQWRNDVKGGFKSLSEMLDEKIITAFQILFNSIQEKEKSI